MRNHLFSPVEIPCQPVEPANHPPLKHIQLQVWVCLAQGWRLANKTPFPPLVLLQSNLLPMPNSSDNIGGVDLFAVVVLLQKTVLGGEVQAAREAGLVLVSDVPDVAGSVCSRAPNTY